MACSRMARALPAISAMDSPLAANPDQVAADLGLGAFTAHDRSHDIVGFVFGQVIILDDMGDGVLYVHGL